MKNGEEDMEKLKFFYDYQFFLLVSAIKENGENGQY